MAGEPEPLLVKALAMQPDNLQGLWLLGIAQNERADYAAAITTWEKLLPLLSEDPRSQQQIRQLITDATQAQSTASDSEVSGTDATPTVESGSLQVEVSVSAELIADLPPDTSVFVYAKAQQGPPMPLAVARSTVSQLPLSVTLSDADAMMPAMKLSAFDQLTVGARLSLSGDAIAQSGDLFGEVSGVVRDPSAPVRIEINETVE